jgi:hypothetical protein
MAPTQNHALVQLPVCACTRRLSTLSGHLIDVSFDKRASIEDYFDRTLQLSQEMPQVLAEAAE